MLELDKADKNSQRPETYDAMRKRRSVSARRKIRSWSRSTSTTSTHATEDDDIVRLSPGLKEASKKSPKAENTRQNGREERQTARDWDPRTHECAKTARDWDPKHARDWDPRTHEENSQGLGPENP